MKRFSLYWIPAAILLLNSQANAQDLSDEFAPAEVEVVDSVNVAPAKDDSAIAERLTKILVTTGWYENPEVRVEEGVAFLSGIAESERRSQWANALARNTEDVVAVVNGITIADDVIWDLTPAWSALTNLGKRIVRYSPLILVGLAFLIISWYLAKSTIKIADLLLRKRVSSHLLRSVISRAIAVPVFLIGVYLVLQVSGLTRLAVTVLGGTGVFGLIVGFAFRDIAENFLASILLSLQRPFASGDRIAVAGYDGFVQSVNIRSTLLMTLEGNHVQIPNATVYKETITNYTANPNARFGFTVGIGYENSISQAQSIALQILREHPGIVNDPEPLILVDELGPSTVNLKAYFWIDIEKFGSHKVRSAVIRGVKSAFDQAQISMPDESREVIFPAGVPVQMHQGHTPPPPPGETPKENEENAHSAEGHLASDAGEIRRQALQSSPPEQGPNLLEEKQP